MTNGRGATGHGVSFQLLGPVRGRRDGTPLDLGPPQQRAVLAALLLRAGAQASTTELTDALWGEEPPARAVGTLRHYAWRLRSVIEPDRPARAPGALLVSVADGYALRVPREALDVHVFEREVAAAARERESGDAAAAHTRLGAALGLWEGTALGGVPGPYARSHRDRLAELRVRAQEDQYDCALSLGRHTEAVAELGALISEHPLRERLRAMLMLALHRSGRQAEALAVYTETRRVLVGELGVGPGAELTELYGRILAADPLTPLTPLRRPGPAPVRPAVTPRAGLVPRQLPVDIVDFIGRTETVDGLLAALTGGAGAGAGAGAGGSAVAVCALSGIGGVGKTALAVHAAHRARSAYPDGQLYVDLRGASPTPAAVGAVLTQFLLALGVPETAIPADVEQRAALYRSRLADRRVFVLLDNAHDTAQVRPLLPGGAGCAVLVTSRARTILLPGARQFEVDVLSRAEARDLLATVVGRARVEAEPQAAEELAEACGHLPLAVRIVASRLAARPGRPLAALLARLRDQRRRLDELKAGDLAVEATFRLGYDALPPEQARAFRLFALCDAPDLPLDAAAALLGTDQDTAETLAEALADAGLLEPYGNGRYRYHDLLRLYARREGARREGTRGEGGAGERDAALLRLLDQLLATAANASGLLEPGHALHLSLHPVTAPGLRFAGEDEARAWLRAEYALLSVTVAQALHGLSELPGGLRAAVDLLLLWFGLIEGLAHRPEFQRLAALAADRAQQRGDAGAEARARYVIGTLHYLTDAYGLAEAELGRSLELAEAAADPAGRHLAANALGILHYATGRPERALALLRLAQELSERSADPGSASRILATLARVHLALGQAAEAVVAAERAVGLAREVGNTVGTARVLYQYGCVLRSTGRAGAAAEQLRESLAHFRSGQHRDGEGLALARTAECLLDLGLAAEAAGCAQEALTIAREQEKAYCQGLALSVLGQALPQLGRAGEGAERLREALRIFDRLGVPEAGAVRALSGASGDPAAG
ncbi:BTAD domain-containing putative transcriptional regulator [Kitasatospora sp. McL0602]|uniref:AfsR/SARP family transcriptional regulator n=1 Tax=Kitasatospora sp. McL0602 TaxID=3439530 RepID=UPI003F8912C8